MTSGNGHREPSTLPKCDVAVAYVPSRLDQARTEIRHRSAVITPITHRSVQAVRIGQLADDIPALTATSDQVRRRTAASRQSAYRRHRRNGLPVPRQAAAVGGHSGQGDGCGGVHVAGGPVGWSASGSPKLPSSSIQLQLVDVPNFRYVALKGTPHGLRRVIRRSRNRKLRPHGQWRTAPRRPRS